MIRIISEITYGYHDGRTVVRKTKNSAPFEMDEKAERELVAKGHAEYVGQSETRDGDITLDYLRSLKMTEIKEIGEGIGVKFKVGTKKEDYIQKVWAAYTPPGQSYDDGDYEDDYNPFGYPGEDDEQL